METPSHPLDDASAIEYLKKILLAPVYDVAVNSELTLMGRLSLELGNSVFLKREDQQPVKSFKLRGAYNCISQLSEAKLASGIVTASAGNHAQGVAFSANRRGVKATIVMPETTPDIKIDAVKRFGGSAVEVVLHGTSFDQANGYARALSESHGMTFIPPFDNADVIAGQGTIARELLEQNPNIQRLFIAVGGGGLAAGIAVFLKQLRPDIQLIAVEAEESACLTAAQKAGHPVTLPSVGIFADGVAVKTIGDEPFKLLNQYIDDVMTVSNDEICAAIKDIFDDTRVIAEPAGALSIAAIRKYVALHGIKDEILGGILCGANTNFHTLRYVSERCELGEQKEAVFAVKLPERAGAFKHFCEAIGSRAVTEFNYRFSATTEAHVFVGIKLKRGRAEFAALLTELQQRDYQCFDLSDNELAKLHVRHMVGGRPSTPLNEHLFSFYFPEYPGALLTFLNTLGEKWNITLFHYRNHGAADGLVLCGFDIPNESRADFDTHLAALGYRYEEQTDNPAYRFFLAH
ncbi:threonine ammonia-lyase, biosynthetic [Alteromonas oceanisediminis]|uniref:threonine ammonia-lyase, biosynthetic n=1 Tax=Alteromonas oceanisediminis TaxID=2836180 RepID=UPI001BD9D275|nr:threonine ammonia-lyase, biosynthetic [Alteromonas oceanisediminis]MBT0586205.1 threonine ammonia-lyase, biosynthetic [Alteromonas oceanisediminis]